MTEPILKVDGLSKAFGALEASRDISLDLRPGEIHALIGPNGAGKSTLFGLLTRLLTTPEGSIMIAGHDLATAPRHALAMLGIVFQQSTLDLDLSVRQNLSYFAALHGISGRDATVRIDAALDKLGMLERAHEKARAINGGHRRRAEIARALIHNPAVLLLDEPTVGLDAAARASITEHVHSLTDEGTTVLWSTHLTDEVSPDDQLVSLHRAQVLAQGTCKGICNNTPLAEKFLTLTAPA